MSSTVYTNGVPKAGNHALVKACQLLGLPCEVHHQPHPHHPGLPVLHIRRDPRNVLISALRHQRKEISAGTVLAEFRHFGFGGAPLVQVMAGYEGWLREPGVLTVCYEDLIANDAEMRRIAAHLQVPYIDGAFSRLPGLTMTWAPVHSDWRAVWTEQLDTAWQAEGGPELLQRWGYA